VWSKLFLRRRLATSFQLYKGVTFRPTWKTAVSDQVPSMRRATLSAWRQTRAIKVRQDPKNVTMLSAEGTLLR